MSPPESQTSPKEALSSFLGAAIGNPDASIPLAPVEAVQATYGSSADVALRIERYLAHDGRENSATLLLYEAMKALRAPGDAQDAERYRTVRRSLTDKENGANRVAIASAALGLAPTAWPTPDQFDAIADHIAAQQGKGGQA